MSGAPEVVEAVADLGAALEDAAGALAAADLDGLLRAELPVRLALERLARRRATIPPDRAALRAEIDRAARALARCRQLGGSLQDVVRLSLDAQGRSPMYGRRDAGAQGIGAPHAAARGQRV